MIPIALALGALGAIGARKSKADADRSADAVAAAQNRELEGFLTRNEGRADQSRGFFDDILAQAQPGRVAATRGAAEASRGTTMRAAAAGAQPMSVATKGSTAGIMAPELSAARGREMQMVDDRIGAQAATDGFGDLVFDMALRNMKAGRKIGTVGDMAVADAQMLPVFQELAGGSAALRNRPRGVGDLITGAATGAGYYLGSR